MCKYLKIQRQFNIQKDLDTYAHAYDRKLSLKIYKNIYVNSKIYQQLQYENKFKTKNEL